MRYFMLFVLSALAFASNPHNLAKLIASDPDGSDSFGWSVAMDDDLIVVGSSAAHAAYVYERRGSGTYVQTEILTSDLPSNNYFGQSVAISGNTIVIGAPYDSDAADYAGAIYIFERNSNNEWIQEVKLTHPAPHPSAYHYLGESIAISGEAVVVGSSNDRNDTHQGVGAAYVFEKRSGWGTHSQKLLAPQRDANDNFGFSVGISNNTIAIGSVGYDGTVGNMGATYIFERNANTGDYAYSQLLTAQDPGSNEQFASELAIDGDVVIVGSSSDDQKGSAYLFERNATTQTFEQKVKFSASDIELNDRFGYSVAVHNDHVLVGSHHHHTNGIANSGAAYLFEKPLNGWSEHNGSEQAKLIASDPDVADAFGNSVVISNDTMVVGAEGDDHSSINNAGSVYVFGADTPTVQPGILMYLLH